MCVPKYTFTHINYPHKLEAYLNDKYSPILYV